MIINPLPNNKISHSSKLKALADDKINLTQKLNICSCRAESIVGKGENAGFKRLLPQDCKTRDCLVKG